MRLTVSELTEQKQSYNVPQRFAAVTSQDPIGTRNLMNCMGIVIYNRLAKCGTVGHVEATGSDESYADAVDQALRHMMHALNTNGGGQGSLSVVLMGNPHGHDEDFCTAVEGSVYRRAGERFRLTHLDFLDLRNSTARGQIRGANTELAGFYSGCILEPASDTLWVDSMGANIGDLQNAVGVRWLSIT